VDRPLGARLGKVLRLAKALWPDDPAVAAAAGRPNHSVSRRRRSTDQLEQLPLPTPSAPKSRQRINPAPEAAAKGYIARRAKPSVVPGYVKLTFTLECHTVRADFSLTPPHGKR